jgi:hypothetical protein
LLPQGRGNQSALAVEDLAEAAMLDQVLDLIRGFVMMVDPAQYLLVIGDTIEFSEIQRFYPIVGFGGFILAIYTMTLISYEHEDMCDPLWVQWLRRFALALTAFAFLWSIQFWQTHGRHPGPPAAMFMFSIMLMMTVRVIAIHLRIRREGRRRVGSNGRIITEKKGRTPA